MSLKHFHTVFIIFAILCDAGFFLWCRIERDVVMRMGIARVGDFSGLIALGLTIYCLWYVLRKCKTIIVES
jgi:hypothetical protein